MPCVVRCSPVFRWWNPDLKVSDLQQTERTLTPLGENTTWHGWEASSLHQTTYCLGTIYCEDGHANCQSLVEISEKVVRSGQIQVFLRCNQVSIAVLSKTQMLGCRRVADIPYVLGLPWVSHCRDQSLSWTTGAVASRSFHFGSIIWYSSVGWFSCD